MTAVAGCALLLLVSRSDAVADESGVAFWTSGSYSSFVAVPPQPGWYVPTQLYYYNGSAGRGESFQHGDSVNLGVSSQAVILFVSPTWAPATKWFGGQPSFTLTSGAGWNSTSADVSISNNTQRLDRTDTVWGAVDLYPQAQLAWNHSNHNWMGYVTGDIPVGNYSNARLSNIGLGHGALDAGGAYTYFDTTGGTEASAIVGFTYNIENNQTEYQSGVDSHLDWDVSQFLSENWQVGIVGYVYHQLTPDSGNGNRVGSFESSVASAGAEVGYSFTAGGLQWYANLRGYGEFWADNRLQGFATYATLNIPLGPTKK